MYKEIKSIPILVPYRNGKRLQPTTLQIQLSQSLNQNQERESAYLPYLPLPVSPNPLIIGREQFLLTTKSACCQSCLITAPSIMNAICSHKRENASVIEIKDRNKIIRASCDVCKKLEQWVLRFISRKMIRIEKDHDHVNSWKLFPLGKNASNFIFLNGDRCFENFHDTDEKNLVVSNFHILEMGTILEVRLPPSKSTGKILTLNLDDASGKKCTTVMEFRVEIFKDRTLKCIQKIESIISNVGNITDPKKNDNVKVIEIVSKDEHIIDLTQEKGNHMNGRTKISSTLINGISDKNDLNRSKQCLNNKCKDNVNLSSSTNNEDKDCKKKKESFTRAIITKINDPTDREDKVRMDDTVYFLQHGKSMSKSRISIFKSITTKKGMTVIDIYNIVEPPHFLVLDINLSINVVSSLLGYEDVNKMAMSFEKLSVCPVKPDWVFSFVSIDNIWPGLYELKLKQKVSLNRNIE